MDVVVDAQEHGATGCAGPPEDKIGSCVAGLRTRKSECAAIVLLKKTVESALANVKARFDGMSSPSQR